MNITLATLVQRFERYIAFDTTSDEESSTCPSTAKQLELARALVAELTELGLTEISMDEQGYVMASLPAQGVEHAPVLGLIAHMDTSPEMAGGPVRARIVEKYDGQDIVLNAEQNIVLSPVAFPELLDYVGQEIMVTDGTTLLGADDKAGICAIISAVEYLLQHPEIKHGKIRLGFTPDEEIGRGADHFDVAAFGADFAYTVDGDALGGLEYENFNAAGAVLTVHGRSVHPGAAKDKLVNALKLACEWQSLLPVAEAPEHTEGYEGFYHPYAMSGGVELAKLKLIIRDHSKERFAERKHYLEQQTAFLNEKYGAGTFELELKDSYYNMREKLLDKMFIVELAQEAMGELGIEPKLKPIRGGTDGSRLSYEGLPCPNLFTGGMNFHGKYEYLPLRSLQKVTELLVLISTKVAQLTK